MATRKKTAQKSKPASKPQRPAKSTAKKSASKSARKPTPKKAVKKAPAKTARKPATKAAKKPVKRPVPVKKAAKKPVAKKSVKAPKKSARKPAPQKPAAKKTAVKKSVKTLKKAASPKVMSKPAPAKPGKAFRKEELAAFRAMLQKQLELVQGNLNALAGDNLKLSPMESTGDISSHSTHMADHGTDNFDRELALSLASSRQDSLYDIEDAIRRIDDGEYGACEACSKPIERPRLKALPFAKKCLACQSEAERGRGRHQPFRSASHQYVPAGDDSGDSSDA